MSESRKRRSYDEAFKREAVRLPVSSLVAQTAAELRSASGLKTPDATRLASAIGRQAAAVLTGDRDFGDSPLTPVLRVGQLTP